LQSGKFKPMIVSRRRSGSCRIWVKEANTMASSSIDDEQAVPDSVP